MRSYICIMYLPLGWLASSARVVCILRLGGLYLHLSGPRTPQHTDSHPCTRRISQPYDPASWDPEAPLIQWYGTLTSPSITNYNDPDPWDLHPVPWDPKYHHLRWSGTPSPECPGWYSHPEVSCLGALGFPSIAIYSDPTPHRNLLVPEIKGALLRTPSIHVWGRRWYNQFVPKVVET